VKPSFFTLPGAVFGLFFPYPFPLGFYATLSPPHPPDVALVLDNFWFPSIILSALARPPRPLGPPTCSPFTFPFPPIFFSGGSGPPQVSCEDDFLSPLDASSFFLPRCPLLFFSCFACSYEIFFRRALAALPPLGFAPPRGVFFFLVSLCSPPKPIRSFLCHRFSASHPPFPQPYSILHSKSVCSTMKLLHFGRVVVPPCAHAHFPHARPSAVFGLRCDQGKLGFLASVTPPGILPLGL